LPEEAAFINTAQLSPSPRVQFTVVPEVEVLENPTFEA
jgi:hypothetical protein